MRPDDAALRFACSGAREAWTGMRSYLALGLDHVLDHRQKGHLVLDALREGQVALESVVQGLTVIWCLCSNHPRHLLHLGTDWLDGALMHTNVNQELNGGPRREEVLSL